MSLAEISFEEMNSSQDTYLLSTIALYGRLKKVDDLLGMSDIDIASQLANTISKSQKVFYNRDSEFKIVLVKSDLLKNLIAYTKKIGDTWIVFIFPDNIERILTSIGELYAGGDISGNTLYSFKVGFLTYVIFHEIGHISKNNEGSFNQHYCLKGNYHASEKEADSFAVQKLDNIILSSSIKTNNQTKTVSSILGFLNDISQHSLFYLASYTASISANFRKLIRDTKSVLEEAKAANKIFEEEIEKAGVTNDFGRTEDTRRKLHKSVSDILKQYENYFPGYTKTDRECGYYTPYWERATRFSSMAFKSYLKKRERGLKTDKTNYFHELKEDEIQGIISMAQLVEKSLTPITLKGYDQLLLLQKSLQLE